MVSSFSRFSARGNVFLSFFFFFRYVSKTKKLTRNKYFNVVIVYGKYAEPQSFGLSVIFINKIESSDVFI